MWEHLLDASLWETSGFRKGKGLGFVVVGVELGTDVVGVNVG